MPLVLLVFQAPSVISAYQGRLPVGGQPSADGGAAIGQSRRLGACQENPGCTLGYYEIDSPAGWYTLLVTQPIFFARPKVLANVEIVNGQIGDMLRDVVLTGNIFETMKHIDLIGDDLAIFGNAGGCGKGGQYPLPVTTGSPHIRIQNLTIGGRAA